MALWWPWCIAWKKKTKHLMTGWTQHIFFGRIIPQTRTHRYYCLQQMESQKKNRLYVFFFVFFSYKKILLPTIQRCFFGFVPNGKKQTRKQKMFLPFPQNTPPKTIFSPHSFFFSFLESDLDWTERKERSFGLFWFLFVVRWTCCIERSHPYSIN